MPSKHTVWYFNNCNDRDHPGQFARADAFFDLNIRGRHRRLATDLSRGAICAVLSRKGLRLKSVKPRMVRIDWYDFTREQRIRDLDGDMCRVFRGRHRHSDVLAQRAAARMPSLKPLFDCLGRVKHGSAFRDTVDSGDLTLTGRKIATILSSEQSEHRVVRGGAGFGDSETNLLVEEAAVTAATMWLNGSGWSVRSVESERCGYDLLCKRRGDIRHVEVKGVQGQRHEFIVTKREMERANDDARFRLIVVTGALTRPHLQEFTGRQFVRQFIHTPTQFRSKRKAV